MTDRDHLNVYVIEQNNFALRLWDFKATRGTPRWLVARTGETLGALEQEIFNMLERQGLGYYYDAQRRIHVID